MKLIRPYTVNGAWMGANNVPENDFANTSIVTLSSATPAIVTWAGHNLIANAPFMFSTTGALPTGVSAGTVYYVSATGLTYNSFEFSATPGGAVINTSGAQSGVHTGAYVNAWNSITTYPLTGRVYLAYDASFTASFSSLPLGGQLASTGVMYVSAIASGTIYVGMDVSAAMAPGNGNLIPRGMTVLGEGSGTGGVGSYVVSLQYNITAQPVIGSLHKCYESLQAGNLNNWPIGGTADLYWLLLGATNAWRAFDESVSNQMLGVGVIDLLLNSVGVSDSIAFFNVNAASIRVTMTDTVGTDGVVYDETFSMISTSGIIDWWSYYFEPIVQAIDLVVDQMPIYNNPSLTATLIGTGSVVAISNGTPATITWPAHNQVAGTPVSFTTTGTLPAGISPETQYLVSPTGLTTNSFQVTTIQGGTSLATTTSGSGVHTAHVEQVACGEIIVGKEKILGYTQYGMGMGIQDYSVKQQDAFGNYSILERAYNKMTTIAIWVDNTAVDDLQNLLALYRATPIVYIGDDSLSMTSSVVYGFYQDFQTLVNYPTVSICNIQFQGLT